MPKFYARNVITKEEMSADFEDISGDDEAINKFSDIFNVPIKKISQMIDKDTYDKYGRKVRIIYDLGLVDWFLVKDYLE